MAWVQRNPKYHPVPIPLSLDWVSQPIQTWTPPGRGHPQLLQTTRSFQDLTTLPVKNLFLISNLNLLSFSLKLLPLIVVKSLSSSFLQAPLQVLEGHNQLVLNASVFQAEQTKEGKTKTKTKPIPKQQKKKLDSEVKKLESL